MTYYFRLPLITELTKEQQAALDEVDAIALSGGPGTGKSVVCLWRHIRNHVSGSKISLLITYTKTLELYLKECAATPSPATPSSAAQNHIGRTKNWKRYLVNGNYQEIIIDEAQDVPAADYESIKARIPKVCYSADDGQSLYQDGCDSSALKRLFPNNEPYRLHKNFRNSKEILTFVRHVFPDVFIPQDSYDQSRITNTKPILKVCGPSRMNQIAYILNVIKEYAGDSHNIAVLVPLRADVNYYFESLSPVLVALGIGCSKYESGDSHLAQINGVHITTFKSSKGTEFDTVIVPDFDEMNNRINLDKISKKDYYVGFTRARTNLFLVCSQYPDVDLVNSVEIEK